jgi:hypothetical protein
MRTNTKRYYVEQLFAADKTLSKTKLFKSKLAELENLYKNLNIKPSTSDDYSRANFEDISDDEENKEEAVSEVQEVVPDIPKVVPKVVQEVVPEIPKKKKFNRRELKQMYLNDFSKDVLGILKDLDEGYINEDIALSEYQILHEEVLGDIEAYTENLELTDKDCDYIDNFFILQERRICEIQK